MRGDRVKNGARDCRGGIFGRERRDAAGRAAERTRRAGAGGDGRMTKREPTDMEKNAATVIDGTAAGLLQARRRGTPLGKKQEQTPGVEDGKTNGMTLPLKPNEIEGQTHRHWRTNRCCLDAPGWSRMRLAPSRGLPVAVFSKFPFALPYRQMVWVSRRRNGESARFQPLPSIRSRIGGASAL